MKNDKLMKVLDEKTDVKSLRLTRRELLEAGVVSFAAQIAVPSAVASILTMSDRAMAQEANPMMPFITLSLSGGAALHGNYVVKNSGGGLLGAYTKLGLGKTGFATEKLFGADFASSAQLHQGVKSVVSPDVLSKTKLVALCTNTANDTNALAAERPFYDLSGPLERAGLVGKLLPVIHQGSGSENLKPVFNSPNSVLAVDNLNSMFGALSYTSSSLKNGGSLNERKRNLLSSLVAKMTGSQIEKLNSKDDGLKALLQDAGFKTQSIITAGGASSVDPRLNQHARDVYGITNKVGDVSETPVNDAKAVMAGVVYNTLMGNCSHGRVTLGGYDYHDPGTRDAADKKDFAAGQQIGRMLELASRLQKPLFILVTTDGACASAISESTTSIWSSDYSSSVQFIIAYDPRGKIQSSGVQVGHYLSDQSVDTSTLVGSRPDYVAAAILANYLSLNNKLDLFKQLAPATLQADDVRNVVKLRVG